MKILLALSEGVTVSFDELVVAGRVATRAAMASQGNTVLYSDEPWFGVWQLDKLTDEETASLGLRFALQLTEFRAAMAE
jgi:hypothetical protein